MRRLPTALCGLVLLASQAGAQGLPDCASLPSADEVRTTCGVPGATVEVERTPAGECRLTAQRDGTASMLTMLANVFESAQEAQATVALARLMGSASDGQSAPGMGNEIMGQMAETLGIQRAGAAEAGDVSAEEAAFRELPDLGDGGVRYVTDVSGALGLVTHTVLFSSGAIVVKLESGIVADRAGVCTADGLEALARGIGGRL